MKKNKSCPRCNFKVPNEVNVCPKCMLNYTKFSHATNLEGKIALSQHEGERVIYRTGCPNDVSKVKLVLLTIFLGFLGAHYYYVGRIKMGVFFSIFAAVGIINGIFTTFLTVPQNDIYQVFSLLVLIWGVVLVMWIIDIFKVCFNKFKIPVSLAK